MFEIGDKVIYQGADKSAYKREGIVKSIEDKDGKPQLTVELDGGETFTAPIDDWSRKFTNAATHVSTNSVVANAMAANAERTAKNANNDDLFAKKVAKLVPLLEQIERAARQAVDNSLSGGIAYMIEQDPTYFYGGVDAYRRLIKRVVAGGDAAAELLRIL